MKGASDRRRASSRALRRLGGICALLLTLTGGAAFWAGGRLVAPAPRTIGAPPPDLPFEAVRIASRSGSTLAGWYARAAGGRGVIVLLHPIRRSRLAMLERARLFWRAGYDVLLIDFQAHGESPGRMISAGYLESFDARAAVEFARTRGGGRPLGVLGVSLGGAAALLASPLGVNALAIESVYPSIEEALNNRVRMRVGVLAPLASALLRLQIGPRWGIPESRLRPIDAVAAVGAPLLMLAGDRDRHTSLSETMRLYVAAREPKRLVVFHGAGHVDLLRFSPERYRDVTLAFFEKQLRAPAPPRRTLETPAAADPSPAAEGARDADPPGTHRR